MSWAKEAKIENLGCVYTIVDFLCKMSEFCEVIYNNKSQYQLPGD